MHNQYRTASKLEKNMKHIKIKKYIYKWFVEL